MKFKLDECMDVRLAVLFVNAGHNAQTVYGEGVSGEPDSEIYAFARENDGFSSRKIWLSQTLLLSHPLPLKASSLSEIHPSS
jgi:hypothetical protein